MANTGKRLGQAVAGTSATTVYTVPAATVAIFSMIRVTSKATVERKITLWAGPDQTDARLIAFETPIPPGGTIELGRGLILNAADVLSALADAASSLAVTACGVEVA